MAVRDTSIDGGTARTTEWTWADDGALATVELPSGRTLDYIRVPIGSGTSGVDHVVVRIDLNGTMAAQVNGRDWMHRPVDIAGPAGLIHRQWDAMGRLKSRVAGATEWWGSFDDRGRLFTETVTAPSAGTWTNHYTYEEPGWLVLEQRGRTGETLQYVYDNAGNRTERWLNGTLDQTITWDGSNATHVDGTALLHDDWEQVDTDQNGFVYTRDSRGQVAGISDGTTDLVELVRDGRGLAIHEDDGGANARLTTWGLGMGQLPLEVRASDGNDLTYLQIAGEWVGVAEGVGTMSTTHPVVTDHNANVISFGSEELERDSAFGTGPTEAADAEERFLFGRLAALPDVPGVMLAQQRLYDGDTGRFLAPDPIGLEGGMHRSRYVSNLPTGWIDPTGLAGWTETDEWEMVMAGAATMKSGDGVKFSKFTNFFAVENSAPDWAGLQDGFESLGGDRNPLHSGDIKSFMKEAQYHSKEHGTQQRGFRRTGNFRQGVGDRQYNRRQRRSGRKHRRAVRRGTVMLDALDDMDPGLSPELKAALGTVGPQAYAGEGGGGPTANEPHPGFDAPIYLDEPHVYGTAPAPLSPPAGTAARAGAPARAAAAAWAINEYGNATQTTQWLPSASSPHAPYAEEDFTKCNLFFHEAFSTGAGVELPQTLRFSITEDGLKTYRSPATAAELRSPLIPPAILLLDGQVHRGTGYSGRPARPRHVGHRGDLRRPRQPRGLAAHLCWRSWYRKHKRTETEEAK
ncbi:MAG: RHS repeat-associated core domain-containing protein [Proteobacteria bacterium]|nr:RHS repeat-associated core domain-containing protein [Pseudomonadota bacterium]